MEKIGNDRIQQYDPVQGKLTVAAGSIGVGTQAILKDVDLISGIDLNLPRFMDMGDKTAQEIQRALPVRQAAPTVKIVLQYFDMTGNILALRGWRAISSCRAVPGRELSPELLKKSALINSALVSGILPIFSLVKRAVGSSFTPASYQMTFTFLARYP